MLSKEKRKPFSMKNSYTVADELLVVTKIRKKNISNVLRENCQLSKQTQQKYSLKSVKYKHFKDKLKVKTFANSPPLYSLKHVLQVDRNDLLHVSCKNLTHIILRACGMCAHNHAHTHQIKIG
jgi:hypothetical protein